MIIVSGKEQKGFPFLEISKGENGRQSATSQHAEDSRFYKCSNSIHFKLLLRWKFRWKFRFNFTRQLGPLYYDETGIQTLILFNSIKTPADVENET